MLITAALIFILFFIFYRRYWPILGIPCKHINEADHLIMIDVRTYIDATNHPVEKSLNIPYAYLKRYFSLIPKQPIHIIANDVSEKNLAIRFLQKLGFSCTKLYNY